MPRKPKKPDAAYLWDMVAHAEELIEISSGKTGNDLKSDRVYRRAVERLVEIIGEACREVSDATRAANPEIPWRAIEAQRHVLAHEYGAIDHDRIWRVVSEHVPRLTEQLRPLLPPQPPDPLPEA